VTPGIASGTIGTTTRGKSAAAAAAAPNVTAPKPTPVREMRDDFLNAASASYLEAMEDEYRADPNSVPESWAALLRQLGESSFSRSFMCACFEWSRVGCSMGGFEFGQLSSETSERARDN